MDLVLAAIVSLIVMGCVDRHLHPEDYRVPGRERSAARVRPAARSRAERPQAAHAVGARAHRCYSVSQASPFLPNGPLGTVSIRE
jgi:hypothetical protein